MAPQSGRRSGGSPQGGSGDALKELVAVYEGDLGRDLRIEVDTSGDPDLTIVAWGLAAVRTVAKAISHVSEDEIDLRLLSTTVIELLTEEFEHIRQALIASKEASGQ